MRIIYPRNYKRNETKAVAWIEANKDKYQVGMRMPVPPPGIPLVLFEHRGHKGTGIGSVKKENVAVVG